MKEERNEKTGRSVSGSGAENRLENVKVVESNKKANSIIQFDGVLFFKDLKDSTIS